jgi:hypothetical protein
MSYPHHHQQQQQAATHQGPSLQCHLEQHHITSTYSSGCLEMLHRVTSLMGEPYNTTTTTTTTNSSSSRRLRNGY